VARATMSDDVREGALDDPHDRDPLGSAQIHALELLVDRERDLAGRASGLGSVVERRSEIPVRDAGCLDVDREAPKVGIEGDEPGHEVVDPPDEDLGRRYVQFRELVSEKVQIRPEGGDVLERPVVEVEAEPLELAPRGLELVRELREELGELRKCPGAPQGLCERLGTLGRVARRPRAAERRPESVEVVHSGLYDLRNGFGRVFGAFDSEAEGQDPSTRRAGAFGSL
jgi:hypothetical protein